MASWQGQVAMATELQAAVAVVRHDRADDVGHLGADCPEGVLLRVVGEDIATGGVTDREHRRRHVTDALVRQGRGPCGHVDDRHAVSSQRQAESVRVIV